MSDLANAIRVAVNAHFGQKDKQGQPYILHPLRVMMQMETDEEKMAAVLHDVLEDTEVTQEDLIAQGFPEKVIEAVLCLTRKEDEEKDYREGYKEYVVRCKSNEIARKVKMADLRDNSLIERSLPNNLQKYHHAWKFLAGKMTEKEYLK